MSDITIEGLDELTTSLSDLVSKYPDRAGELLRKQAGELRNGIVEKTKALTNADPSSKASLARTGSYRVTQPKGLGGDQYVEITAKSPHFHLVEHGHDMVTPGGRTVGFVQGRHQLDTAVKQYEGKMPEAVEEMVDGLLREGGFL